MTLAQVQASMGALGLGHPPTDWVPITLDNSNDLSYVARAILNKSTTIVIMLLAAWSLHTRPGYWFRRWSLDRWSCLMISLGLGIMDPVPQSAADPYPDFPVSANLADAWLANLAYMFTDVACTTRVTTAAQRVKGWKGRRGNILAQATTLSAPVADQTGGIWSLEFNNAATRHMTVTLPVAQPTTIYIADVQDTIGGSSYEFDGIDGTDRQASIIDAAGIPTIYAGAFVAAGAMPASPRAFCYRFNGASGSVRSAAGNTAGDTGALGVAGYTLGARFNITQGFDKKIYAFMVYSALHNNTVADSILAWLRTNFGVN